MNPIRLDLETAIERMGGKDIFLEIARFFAARLPETLGEMEAALQTGDMPALTRLAHSCKSNCAGVGAEEERGLCLALEQAARAEDKTGATAALDRLRARLPLLKEALESLR